MKTFKTDIAVALIFFNRPDCFKEVFKAVAEARPSRLYLIQDGARANKPDDQSKIDACREIVSHIDWECEVIKDYSDINLGCGKRIFTGLSNVFNHEEYAAIIEDDIKIGDSFLPFCKEMCERYKDDQRIQLVSGMNHLGVYEESPYSYIFSRNGGAIWGWATWARCWKELEWELTPASNPYILKCLREQTWQNHLGSSLADRAEEVRNKILQGVSPSFWSLHFGFYAMLSNRINIVPKYNLISNIGLTADSVHAVNSIQKLPKRLRVVFFAKIYSLKFPLVHPQYVLDDQHYLSLQNKIMCPSKFMRFIELFGRLHRKIFR